MAQEQMKIQVFFSYSHQDEKYRDELEKHLTMLKRSNMIRTWHDRKINAGSKWDDNIKEELNNSHLIILLLSKDFLASDYIWNNELSIIRNRQSNPDDTIVVIPVFLHPCDTSDLDQLSYQGLPNDMKWIISSSWPYPDEAFSHVAKGIRDVVKRLVSTV